MRVSDRGIYLGMKDFLSEDPEVWEKREDAKKTVHRRESKERSGTVNKK